MSEDQEGKFISIKGVIAVIAALITGMVLIIFTFMEGKSRSDLEATIVQASKQADLTEAAFQLSQTPNPTSTLPPTETPEPHPPSDAPSPTGTRSDHSSEAANAPLWISGDYSLGTFWSAMRCNSPSGTIKSSGELLISLPDFDNDSDRLCSLKTVDKSLLSAVKRISITVLMPEEVSDQGSWIGIRTSCGNQGYAFMLSPSRAAYFDPSDTSLPPENQEDEWQLNAELPLERTLSAKWDGNFLIFGLLDPSTQDLSVKSIPCQDDPQWLEIGAMTRPGGYLVGTITDLRIWKK